MTYHPYDLMIEGRGLFPVQTQNGEVGYTRAGTFHLDQQGRVMNSVGATLIPQITVPANALNVVVTPSGEVKVQLPGEGEATIGQLQLVSFPNEQGLMATGNGMYRPSAASGAPIQGIPGENGFGQIQQGAVEGSNVNIASSMVDMIATQRAYEMGTKVMGVADQMWSTTANIK